MTATAIGAIPVGAFVIAAFTIGALAIGKLGIHRTKVDNARFKTLEVDALIVKRIRVAAVAASGSVKMPRSADGRNGVS